MEWRLTQTPRNRDRFPGISSKAPKEWRSSRQLQLLDFVAAFLQQRYDAIWTRKVKRTGDYCGWFAGFQFCFDPRDPFDISLVNKARGNLGSLFPQVCVPGPKRSSVSFSPRAAHPGKFARTTLGLIERIAEKEFTIAIRQSAENRHMLFD
jgi:hypothetical protein